MLESEGSARLADADDLGSAAILFIQLLMQAHKKKTKIRTQNWKQRNTMMFARSLDFAHQTHPPLRRISQSRAGGPEKLAIAAVSVGLVTAGLVLARNNDSMKRHSFQPHSFAYPVVSRRLSTSRFTCAGNPIDMLLDNNLEPMMLTLKAEAGECRETELRCLPLGPHKRLERFKHRD
jgi:hypothetical protein